MKNFRIESLEAYPLAENTALLKLTLRAAKAGSWAWDVMTGEVFWSEEFHYLVGTSPATCQPSFETWLRTIHPEDREVAVTEMNAALRERRPVDNQFRVVRPDGTVLWVNSKGQALYAEDGTPLRMVGVTFDITERKRTEEELRRREEELRIITHGVPALISYVDSEQRYQFNNRVYEEWFGLSPEELQGRQVLEILGAEAYEEIRPYIESALAGREVWFQMCLPYQGPGSRYVEARYVPRFDSQGNVQGFFALIHDVTEQKQAEAALRESEEALRKANQRKDEFLAMLAHELRNPLAPIRNAAQAMGRLVPPGSQFQRMREVIERQTDQLTRLVDDLLDVARISQGKIALRRETVDLAAVLEQAIETCRPLLDAGGHRLTVALPDEAVRLLGDGPRLDQVFSNLLSNAAKYTEKGGNVWLTVERRGGQVWVLVKDDGIGIPADVLPHIFELFTQADRGLDRAQGGLGIGLTLVKNIVEMHGGTVEARSAGSGQGSELAVCLPVLSADAEPAGWNAVSGVEEPGLPAALPARYRVLVVDDNVDAAESLALLLELDGQEVRTAHDGPRSLDAAQAFRPHLILLDIGLPGMDGYEVASRLREWPETRNAVLVALTGYGQPEDRERSRVAGFDHHLTKPVDFEVLAALIRSLAPAGQSPAGVLP